MTRGKTVALAFAVLMIVTGAIWTGQGLGWIKGSPMTGQSAWATLGPIVAGLGVALGIVTLQRKR
jgi:hypothetical protein